MQSYHTISENPKFKKLVGRRSRFAWTLSWIMLLVYLAFVLLVAFGKDFLGTPIGDGVTTIGIPIGIGIIVFAFLLTGIYVAVANSSYDEMNQELVDEVTK